MKRFYLLICLLFILLTVIAAQNSEAKKDPIGKWIFAASSAPEGYTAGTIEIGYTDKKYSASMVFSGNENKFIGNRVKYEKDTLYFNVSVDGQDVAVKLTYVNNTKMSGKAVYSEGEVPLTLTHEMKKE